MLLMVHCRAYMTPHRGLKTIMFTTLQHHQHQHQRVLFRSLSAAISSADVAPSDPSTTPPPSPPIVVVKRNRQSMEFRKGSQLVFEGAVAYTSGSQPLAMADLVQVWVEQDKATAGAAPDGGRGKKNNDKAKTAVSYKHYGDGEAPNPKPNQLIGWGVYNPTSLYRVRILCHANLDVSLANALKKQGTLPQIGSILRYKINTAIQTRRALRLPSEVTDTYRLVNGEGDGLSGLAVDVLNNLAVVMSSASWCEVHREQIETALTELTNLTVIWKTTPSRLKQDGWERQRDDVTNGESAEEMVVTKESGVRYQTYPFQDGQKTGVYCDQRENKYNLAMLCRNKRVLDLCCYHGGFSLTAKVLGGATHCTGVDSSQDAIDICHENSKLNGLTGADVDFVRDDIDNFMKVASDEGKSWDVIILDPPKLAPSVSGLERASRKYHSLNRDAIKLMDPENGGLLLTCTCSAAMTQKDGGQYFLETVQQAAISAGRQVTLLRTSGAASCHTQSPASYPAGAYLTAALFYVAPKSL